MDKKFLPGCSKCRVMGEKGMLMYFGETSLFVVDYCVNYKYF